MIETADIRGDIRGNALRNVLARIDDVASAVRAMHRRQGLSKAANDALNDLERLGLHVERMIGDADVEAGR